MKIITEPTVYLVGRQETNDDEIGRFLTDHGTEWETDAERGAETLIELGGRVCYMSFGSNQGRKTNEAYIDNIIGSQHGSVLEHGVWNFIITGVSRSFTHELVRHRSGWGYSQLSQRYVDESTADFVEPDLIAQDPEAHGTFLGSTLSSHEAYNKLVVRLTALVADKYPELTKTDRRKMARQAARSVLPNATETKIFVTANARALRHFLELRGSSGAEPEIRKVAIQLLGIMQEECPTIFKDFSIKDNGDGTRVIVTPHHKV